MKTLLSAAIFIAAVEIGYWIGVAMGRATCKRCDPEGQRRLRETVGGHPSGPTKVTDLKPPPSHMRGKTVRVVEDTETSCWGDCAVLVDIPDDAPPYVVQGDEEHAS